MRTPSIATEEFAARRSVAVEAAGKAGFDALLVCSRGGGCLDRYADVMYLTNFYTSFPYTPDLDGEWTARAHAFLILPVGADPHLVIDMPDLGQIRLEDGRTTYTNLVLEGTVAALRQAGLAAGRVGLVGSDVLTFHMHRYFAAALPSLRLEPADALLSGLRMLKSPAEVDLLRRAAWIGSRAIDAMMDAAVPGALHGDLVAAAMQVLAPHGGALYNSFMASGRGGEGGKLVRNGFPTWGAAERLESGDFIRVGLSGVVDGYVFDLSRARPVGAVPARQIEMFEAAISVVEAAIAAVRPGATAGEVADAGFAMQRQLNLPAKSVFSALGHGVGLGWDSPWLSSGTDTRIAPSMVLCLERTIMVDGFLGDFEETVLVTESGAEILTDARVRYW